MNPSITEENYLKAIFHLSNPENKLVSTNAIATEMQIAAATVTDMLKKLAGKKVIKYEPYKGASLTKLGNSMAGKIIRKHRLWETFLVEKLFFKWDEVHEIAEQLEHIHSDELINRIDKFLGMPKTDPHGDPIPNSEGVFEIILTQPLSVVITNDEYTVANVGDQSISFLQLLDKLNIKIGSKIKLIEKHDF